MTYNFLQSVQLMADAVVSFTDNCVVGIAARTDNIRGSVERSLMLVTALVPTFRYRPGRDDCEGGPQNGTTLREEALKDGITATDFDAIVRPEQMIAPSE